MRRFALVPSLALALLALAAGAWAGAKPDFRLPSLDGKKLGPRDFSGRVVVVDFWATWCGPCHLQAEILDKVVKQYTKGQAQFLGVDVGEDEKTVRAFVKERPFPYPVLLDEKEKVAEGLGVVGFPTLLIVNGKGEVSYLRVGIVPEKRLHDLLQQAGAAPDTAPAASKSAAAR
jgi:thiol-disulfide isomerase/thioredoxin